MRAGEFHTERIIANQGLGNYAAQLCAAYQGGNYGDWYLPSKYTLNLMWLNLADSDGNGLNSGPSDPNNLGNFAADFYWSSTELDSFLAQEKGSPMALHCA